MTTAEVMLKEARLAGLSYSSDSQPGFTRRRHGKSFIFLNEKGKPIRDPKTLERIRKLGIPPAYRDVWICPSPDGHIQAVGRDARGRKQYRYHPDWTKTRDQTKYERILAFARALPKIRRITQNHLRKNGLSREKVLATVVQLLEKTLIRVGNDEYAKTNKAFGLTTLRDHHAQIKGERIRFHFRGKHGIWREIELEDRRLARIIRQCQELPGQEIFQYFDEEGVKRDVKSDDVNAYLKEISGQDFTAKDFRTWAGTVLAVHTLREFQKATKQSEAKKNVIRAIETVAKRLGNTKAICKKCYIHPEVLNAYLDGDLIQILEKRSEQELKHSEKLSALETSVLAILNRRLKKKL